MKLSLNKSALALSFLDGTTTINANNFLWEKFEIELTEPLTNRESLWITFSSDTSGDISKDALLSEDGLTASLSTEAFTEITKIAGTWRVQAFIRVYSTTVDGAYVQAPTNTVEFTVSDGLSVWGDAPPTNETIVNLYEQAKTATEKVEEVLAAAESSAENAEKAATSAAEAATSEENAKTSEDNAKASEETAKKSANSAESSAAEAADSEKNAKTSEDNAKTSEENAATAAAEAEKALQKITNVYRYCGSVDKYTDLPTDADAGDVYNVETAYVDKDGKEYSAGTNYAWNGERWDPLGGNLSDKLDKVTTTDNYKRAYIIKSDGSQATLNLSPNVQGGFLVMRGENGEVFVPTAPNADSCATSKKYVDTVAETAVETAVKQAVTLDGDQTISGAKTFENVQVDGALLLPNSPTSPEEVTVEETFSARETGGGVNTVVDGETVLVEKIAGSTQNCYSLVDFSSAASANGLTVTANNNTLTISGTPTADYANVFFANITDLLEDGKTYTMWQSVAFSSATASGAFFIFVAITDSEGNVLQRVDSAVGQKTFTCNKSNGYIYRIWLESGAIENVGTINSTISFMLYEGTDEKPYQPYFKGLKNAYFEKVVSTGKNLVDVTYDFPDVSGTIKFPCAIAAGTYTLQVICDEYDGIIQNVIDAKLLDASGKAIMPINKGSYMNAVNTSATFTITEYDASRVKYISAYRNITYATALIGKEIKVMLNHGTEALPYEPYTESELGFSSSPDLAVVEEVAHVNDSSEIAEEAAQYNNSVIYLSDMSNVHVGMLVDFYMDGTIISGATARQIMFLDTEAKYIVIDGADPMENVPIDTTVRRSAQVKLPEWDYILPQEQKIVRQTGRVEFTGTESFILTHIAGSDGSDSIFAYKTGVTSITANKNEIISNKYVTVTDDKSRFFMDDGYIVQGHSGSELEYIYIRDDRFSTVDEWKAYLAEQYAAGDPVIVEYKLAEATEEDIVVGDNYTAYQGGLEKVVQGNTDNSDYGAENTVTSTYKIVENPNEAACKAYVQNGLAKKLDKTGGVITGSLIVEGGTKTSLKGFVSRSEEGTFGMVYDLSSKAFMLGFGEVDEDGNFSFSEGEGLPVTLREDSSAFEDGTVVQWSSDGNKLVPTDLRVENIVTVDSAAVKNGEGEKALNQSIDKDWVFTNEYAKAYAEAGTSGGNGSAIQYYVGDDGELYVKVGAFSKYNALFGGQGQTNGSRAFAANTKNIVISGGAGFAANNNNFVAAQNGSAFGNSNAVLIEAQDGFVTGNKNVLYAYASFSAGGENVISVDTAYSSAIGYQLRTSRWAQNVVGQWNANNADAFFIVGNGTGEDDRSNAFGESRFARNSLVTFAQGLCEDGILSLCAPAGRGTPIPLFSLIFPIMLYEYIEYSKDESILSEVERTLDTVVRTFIGRVDKEKNLIADFPYPYWNYYEWSEGLDNEREINRKKEDEYPTRYSLILNCAFILSLRYYEKLCRLRNVSFAYDTEKIAKAIRSTFYVEEEGLFKAYDEGKPFFNVLGNSYAILCGLGGKELAERMIAKQDIIPVTLSMNTFFYDALLSVDKGYADFIVKDIDRRYHAMLVKGATTFWETEAGTDELANTGSLCHGWSAMPIYYYNLLNGADFFDGML